METVLKANEITKSGHYWISDYLIEEITYIKLDCDEPFIIYVGFDKRYPWNLTDWNGVRFVAIKNPFIEIDAEFWEQVT